MLLFNNERATQRCGQGLRTPQGIMYPLPCPPGLMTVGHYCRSLTERLGEGEVIRTRDREGCVERPFIQMRQAARSDPEVGNQGRK